MIDSFLTRKCFACQSSKLDVQYSTGDVVCLDCGEVISHVISEGNETVDYGGNDDSSHPTSRVSGLSSSFISSQTEFVDGPEHIRAALKRAQVFSQDKQEAVVTKNIHVVNDYCDRLYLGRSIQECAIELFTKTLQKRLVASKSKEPVIAACVYLASRLKHTPRTLQEVSLALYVEHQVLSHYQSLIARGLELPLGQATVGPEHLVNRYCALMHLPPQCSGHAHDMARAVTQLELFTDTPQRLAGAVILWVAVLCRVELDLVELSVVCQVRLAQLKFMFVRLFDSLSLTVSPALCEVFCGRPGVKGDSLSVYLPARDSIAASLLGRSKTIVLPRMMKPCSASAVPTSSSSVTSSSSSGCTSTESLASLTPSVETEELLYNFNYYARKRQLDHSDDLPVTEEGKSWIPSYLPYTRPQYPTCEPSSRGLVVCKTRRKHRMLSARGVEIVDDVVDIPSLVKGFGLQYAFKPFKIRKLETVESQA